jgi:TolC family type I secretion outer membrane protein
MSGIMALYSAESNGVIMNYLPRRVSKKAILVASAVGLSMLATSVQVQAETLTDAFVGAYVKNPEIKASRAALRVADEDVATAMSGWRPTVQAIGSVGTQSDRLSGSSGTVNRSSNPYTGELRLSQSLYAGGETESGVKQAESVVDVRQAELLSVENNILADAAVAYLDVVRDVSQLELTISNEKVLQRQLEATNDRFEVGEVTRTDVAQSEARLSRATADKVSARGNLAVSRATYLRVVGVAPGDLEPVTTLPDLPDNAEDAIDISLKNNPRLIAAMEAERAADHAADVAFAALLPTVDVIGSVSGNYDSNAAIYDDNENQYLEARLVIPLYQGGAAYSGVRRAKEVRSQRKIDVETTRQLVVERADQAFEVYEANRAEIISRREQIRANEIALEGVRQEAAVGSRTTLDVPKRWAC